MTFSTLQFSEVVVGTLIAVFLSFIDSGKFPEIDQFRADLEPA